MGAGVELLRAARRACGIACRGTITAEGGAAVVERTRRTYSGRVEFGEDLMVIEVGDEVVVRRRGANALR